MRQVITTRQSTLATERAMTVARTRLLGWLGRVVVQSLREPTGDNPLPHVTCEGEGVLLLSKVAD